MCLESRLSPVGATSYTCHRCLNTVQPVSYDQTDASFDSYILSTRFRHLAQGLEPVPSTGMS